MVGRKKKKGKEARAASESKRHVGEKQNRARKEKGLLGTSSDLRIGQKKRECGKEETKPGKAFNLNCQRKSANGIVIFIGERIGRNK